MELSKKRRRKLQAQVDQDYGYRAYEDRDVYVAEIKGKGRGVIASRQFLPGELVIEITGQLIAADDYDGSTYAMNLDDAWYLEPIIPGAYINHSCNPNCDMVQVTEVSNGLVARCNIEPGTELTFDYQWEAQWWIPKCCCGSKNCRGWVVAEDDVKKMKRLVSREKRKAK
ncbi:SET domain-containing protein [Roseiconus lacunae]|uniref:SET domain-containing protein n=1 Tax=Roseiconus lacunae TaxID=2605694 RepID=A0ABT7PRI0_9BACT|nr:SET domain-containing protein [Roseiconus lacunae]MCD0458283.1 SET domain-containing protein [Roseiconus lacunae]MDM4019108.1 SET domain-containing protein [Roseiconus lacunae]WRQ52219.1 SET domain-containing protein [Stieleria sp. HD01]